MKISNQLSDDAILAELGERITHRRVEFNLTQAQLAHESGVSKRTVERLENGASVQLTSLIRVLRALALLDGLEMLLPAAKPGPMELLRHGKLRQRVKPSSVQEKKGEWTWADDKDGAE